MFAKGQEVGEEKDWEFGVSRYKVLYTRRTEQKVLLYIAQGVMCDIL